MRSFVILEALGISSAAFLIAWVAITAISYLHIADELEMGEQLNVLSFYSVNGEGFLWEFCNTTDCSFNLMRPRQRVSTTNC